MPPTERDFQNGFATQARLLDAYRRGELKPGEWRPMRLSYGLYYQLDHTSHMQRLKIPGGLLGAEQLDVLADLTERYARGITHITTRQDLQFHWISLDSILDMYARLHAVGISSRGACADSVRNVTACPDAGVDPAEAFDVTPYALALHTYFLFNPLNLTLPRKFKISVSGCAADCAQGSINDIGLYAHRQGDMLGFAVYAGGGLSSQPYLARRVRDFLPATDALIMCEAIVRVQHRYGERKNRHKARMKYLVKQLGEAKFVAVVDAEFARVERERGVALRSELAEAVRDYRVPSPALPGGGPLVIDGPAGQWARLNTRPQRQAGYRTATVTVPIGDLTTAQVRGLAGLARRFGNGTVRLTNEQNVVMPWLPDGHVGVLHGELSALGLGEPGALHMTDVVSCPGMDYCSLAMTRSMGVAERIRAGLGLDGAALIEAAGDLRIKISGCPNACGQHHVGDIGLTGVLSKDADGIERPHYSILVGGAVGERGARLARRLGGRYREEVATVAVGAVARFFVAERQADERFTAFVERVGVDRLSAVAQGAVRDGAA